MHWSSQYREVLCLDLDEPLAMVHAKRAERWPVVLTKSEVQAVLLYISHEYPLMARLLYGSGPRLTELIPLRVQDMAFNQRQIVIRDGNKGAKYRVTLLPTNLVGRLPLTYSSGATIYVPSKSFSATKM